MPEPHSLSPTELWSTVTDRLRVELAPAVYGMWFPAMQPLSVEGEVLEVAVPNDFTRAWVEGQLGELVARAAQSARPELSVRFSVRSTSEPAAPAEQQPEGAAAPSALGRPEPVRLHARYTFDSFVIGSSNRFAHAAALAVAEAPGQAYNPLVIHGGTGLGKTHLLQAIAQYAEQHTPGLRARYLTCEAFTNEFIAAVKDKRIEAFKQRFRTAYDLLLIDDVQFLAGKGGIQEEFFHTFNTLHESGRQLVLTADRPAREIPDLADRLRSRFEWGLVAKVDAPDLETRIAILQKRVAADRIAIADSEVFAAIARRVPSNIRELEGALTRVLAYARLTGRTPTEALVRETLHDLADADAPVPIDAIKRVIADTFSVSLAALEGPGRTQAIVAPRQLAMYLCRELTDASLPAIGRAFGGRDHTTVLYAVTKIAERIGQDRRQYDQVRDLIHRIKRA